MKISRVIAGLFVFIAFVGVAFLGAYYLLKEPVNPAAPVSQAELEDHYLAHVQPVFTAKCIACHSCFNSPCQLDLTSYDGVQRGATPKSVYDFPIKDPNPPTRIKIDATTESGWRKKGFFTVLNPPTPGPSLLVELSRPDRPSKQKTYNSEEASMCLASASADHIKGYFAAYPGGRMPFGFPALHDSEFELIEKWVRDGAVGPSKEALAKMSEASTAEGRTALRSWENSFNLKDFKSRLTARYIYEHLFAAHITVEEVPGELFRLVRAKNQDGPVEELPSRRPFDDLGQEFFYRFKKFSAAPVAKTNLLYKLDENRKASWNKLFYQKEWNPGPEKFPSYGLAAANAFVTYQKIPADSRYRFLLEDAYYHISTFIKGPVCRGQTALNVINDHFWVMFLEPKFDVVVNDREVYEKIAPSMAPPASAGDELTLFKNFREGYWGSLQHKYKAYREEDKVFSPSTIWDGDGHNPDALLTVYRHFDSAQVMKGAWGEVPKTVWVIDYQVFEDIYYNLVAGYDVFSPLVHQLNTRLYMEISRISSEDMFLNFLPKAERAPLRASWYKDTPESKKSIAQDLVELIGDDVKELSNRKYPYLGSEIKTETKLTKDEFLTTVFKDRFTPEVRGAVDVYNRLGVDKQPTKLRLAQSITGETKTIAAFREITGKPHPFVQRFPEASLIRVRGPLRDRVYTLIHNKAHLNVSLLLFEDERRDFANDTLNVIPGFAASYPNLYFDLEQSEVEDFATNLSKVRSKQEWFEFLKRYAVDRKSEKFWALNAWFNEQSITKNLDDPGYLDLNRYEDSFVD